MAPFLHRRSEDEAGKSSVRAGGDRRDTQCRNVQGAYCSQAPGCQGVHYSSFAHLRLKTDSPQVLMRVRSVFPSMLSPHSLVLFQATWEELSTLQPAYHLMYIEEERQSRLEDA